MAREPFRSIVREVETVMAELLDEVRTAHGGGMERMPVVTRQRYEAGEVALNRLRRVSFIVGTVEDTQDG